MTVERYLAEKKLRAERAWQPRAVCARCLRPQVTCYCEAVKPFAPKPVFVILMHHLETRRGIASGRMAHICLSNSLLFEGTDVTHHREVNAILADPRNHCVVLWPHARSVNLSMKSPEERKALVPPGKQLVVFLLDATWAQAKRMKRLSRNLHALPFWCFTPERPSEFRVRIQPAAHCLSTVEAVDQLLMLLDPQPEQATLLRAFRKMVETQLHYEATLFHPRRALRRRRLIPSSSR